MAWRIHQWVRRGELDNRQKGIVCGKLWHVGRLDPLELHLRGNCWRDLAGCRLTFTRAADSPLRNPATRRPALHPFQEGVVGDITASRKVKAPTLTEEELREHIRLGLEIPYRWGNCLYLEWFSTANGRVVLESLDFALSISERAWELTAKEERQQRAANARRLQEFMHQAAEMLDHSKGDEEGTS